MYAEIVRALHRHERVEILCQDEEIQDSAAQMLDAHGVRENFRLHIVPDTIAFGCATPARLVWSPTMVRSRW